MRFFSTAKKTFLTALPLVALAASGILHSDSASAYVGVEEYGAEARAHDVPLYGAAGALLYAALFGGMALFRKRGSPIDRQLARALLKQRKQERQQQAQDERKSSLGTLIAQRKEKLEKHYAQWGQYRFNYETETLQNIQLQGRGAQEIAFILMHARRLLEEGKSFTIVTQCVYCKRANCSNATQPVSVVDATKELADTEVVKQEIARLQQELGSLS